MVMGLREDVLRSGCVESEFDVRLDRSPGIAQAEATQSGEKTARQKMHDINAAPDSSNELTNAATAASKATIEPLFIFHNQYKHNLITTRRTEDLHSIPPPRHRPNQ
jgi:hypothetical protein